MIFKNKWDFHNVMLSIPYTAKVEGPKWDEIKRKWLKSYVIECDCTLMEDLKDYRGCPVYKDTSTGLLFTEVFGSRGYASLQEALIF
jgi:hypothetical protein